MNDTGTPNIREIIMKEYELTDAYHDRKEHSAWIASTVFFAFAIGFFNYWPDVSEPTTFIKTIVTIICSSVFTGAMSFISLQFKSRWDSVVRTSMYNWLFQHKWEDVTSPENYCMLQKMFEKREKQRQSVGLIVKRRVRDIFWMTPLLPILLIVNFLYLVCIKKDPNEIRVDEFEAESPDEYPNFNRIQKKQYRKKRRLTAGLIETKYRTEIPAYTISLYFFIAQIISIWMI